MMSKDHGEEIQPPPRICREQCPCVQLEGVDEVDLGEVAEGPLRGQIRSDQVWHELLFD